MAEATRNVWGTGWPVLLPVAVAVLGPALGAQGVLARTAPVLVVVAGSALLPPPRFAVLCLTTLACAAATTWTGPSAGVFAVLLAEGVLTVPFVVAGRALWLTRRAKQSRQLRTESTLVVRAHAPMQPIQLDGTRSS